MTLRPPEDEDIRVLHVDGQPQCCVQTQTQLERISDDISVISEPGPETALDRLSSSTVDCVISDYQMPNLDGVEFLQRVRAAYPNLPFILFTGEGSEEVATEATTAGATAYVKKDCQDVYQVLANQVKQSVASKRSERRAQVANDRLLAFYEQIDGLYILAHDWTVLYWNQEMAARTGYDADSVLGQSFWEVFPEPAQTDFFERLEDAMRNRTPVEFEFEFEGTDERAAYWVEIRAFPVDEGLAVHSRDITEEKAREAELTRRNQILESFANTVSHDFRNPLSLAQGHLQLAQETGDFSHLEEVTMAHNRMRNLIDDLLQHAREEDCKQSTVSLRESARTAWGTVSSDDVTLVVQGDLSFSAYKSQLRRLFENLYWNAIDHGNATKIRVGPLDRVGFYVEDDGRGIPESERDAIFEAGYSTSEDGTGYGLHIVESLVEMHDWRISVTESDDSGARFEIQGVILPDSDR